LCEYKRRVQGYRRVISHATCQVPSVRSRLRFHRYGLARLPQLGSLTTARLPKSTARAAIPPLFSSPFNTRHHRTRRILLAMYHPRWAASSTPSSSTSYSSRRLLFAIVLAAGILTTILTDIVLVASYCTTSHCLSL